MQYASCLNWGEFHSIDVDPFHLVTNLLCACAHDSMKALDANMPCSIHYHFNFNSNLNRRKRNKEEEGDRAEEKSKKRSYSKRSYIYVIYIYN